MMLNWAHILTRIPIFKSSWLHPSLLIAEELKSNRPKSNNVSVSMPEFHHSADLDILLKTWLKVLQINVWNCLLMADWYSIGTNSDSSRHLHHVAFWHSLKSRPCEKFLADFRASAILEDFFCVGLGSICFVSCLDSCYETYVIITEIKDHF